MSNLIDGVEIPPVRSLLRQWHKVHGPRRGNKLKCLILSRKIRSVLIHYHPECKREFPHFVNRTCMFCERGWNPRWKGFAAARWLHMASVFVLEITEGAARRLAADELVRERFRGREVHLSRSGDYVNSPVYPEVFRGVDEKLLLPEFDVMPSVLRVWQMNEKMLPVFEEEYPDKPGIFHGPEAPKKGQEGIAS